MAEFKEVKLRIELDVQNGEGSAESSTVPPAAAPAVPPRVVPATSAPGRAGLPGSVGMPGAPGAAGSPSATGRGWAPIPDPVSAPGTPGPSVPSGPPPIPGTPAGLSPAATLAAERQVAATVASQIEATISGASPGRGAVQALIQAGAGASGVGGVLPVLGVAAAGTLATVLAVERFGPSVAIAVSKIPGLQELVEGLGGGAAAGMMPTVRDFERFSRGAAEVRSNLSAALDIGQNLEETVTDQAVLFGRADVPLAAREAHAQYRIDASMKALERWKDIYEHEKLAGATSVAEFFTLSLLSGLSHVVGR